MADSELTLEEIFEVFRRPVLLKALTRLEASLLVMRNLGPYYSRVQIIHDRDN